MSTPKADLGAGFSTAVTKPSAASKELQHGNTSQFARALAMGSYFLTGVMAVNISQVIGTPLYLINKDWYNAWMAFTKQSVGLLVTTMTQFWAPTTVIVSGDKSMRGQLLQTVQGNLYCDFPHRLVFIANHQIYTDWLYIWWLAYASGMHGRIYIVLKESLRRIPLIGWGMQFFKFIFLKRNWEQDKPNLAKHMKHLNNASTPMWLTIFPEGTNLAPSTRRASARWAGKQGIKDLRHTLLPRSTGLRFMLLQLKETVDWVYDCTIAYEGVPRGEFAQDIYTLRAMYAGGRGPDSVSMHFRRFNLSTIPLEDADDFEKWLRARWTEKDNLLEHYMQKGFFPADSGAEQLPDGRIRRGTGHIKTQIRANKWYEFLQCFAPIGLFAMILYTFYGALPKKMVKSIQRSAIQDKIDMIRKAGQQLLSAANKPKEVPGSFTITNHQLAVLKKAMTQKNITINNDTIQSALEAGFFKPKNGLPANGTNRLAITNGSIPQLQAAEAVKKNNLSSAQKRAKARQREADKTAGSTTASTNGAIKTSPSATSKPSNTSATKTKQTSITPITSVAQLKPATQTPRQPKPAIKTTTPTTTTKKPTSTPIKQTTAIQAPTTKSKPSQPSQPTTTKKNLPKLGASINSDTKSTTSSTTSTSTKSIPKLEIRSNGPNKANSKPLTNGIKPSITNGVKPNITNGIKPVSSTVRTTTTATPKTDSSTLKPPVKSSAAQSPKPKVTQNTSIGKGKSQTLTNPTTKNKATATATAATKTPAVKR